MKWKLLLLQDLFAENDMDYLVIARFTTSDLSGYIS